MSGRGSCGAVESGRGSGQWRKVAGGVAGQWRIVADSCEWESRERMGGAVESGGAVGSGGRSCGKVGGL